MDFLRLILPIRKFKGKNMGEFDNEDLIRSFEEFDEKLPAVAKVIVRRGIDFSILIENDDEEKTSEQLEAHREVFRSIYAILREMVECTSEMTSDESEHYFNTLLIACELVIMVNDGMVCEEEQGKFFLTSEGEAYLRELQVCEAEESAD